MRGKRRRTTQVQIGPRRAGRGFTILDVLVTLSVVSVLIAMLLPALATVKESANRVVCSSNVRQLGLGLALYAQDNRDRIPPTKFTGSGASPQLPGEMMRLRLNTGDVPGLPAGWDGLGLLYSQEYLVAPKLYYCPSHRGDHPFDLYADSWMATYGTVFGNYQYRGAAPNGNVYLSLFDPLTTALIADGLRTQLDFNHVIGANVLRADLSVYWFIDSTRTFLFSLPTDVNQATEGQFANAWKRFDLGGLR